MYVCYIYALLLCFYKHCFLSLTPVYLQDYSFQPYLCLKVEHAVTVLRPNGFPH